MGWEDPLKKGKAIHSSILAWRIQRITIHGVAKSRTWLSDFHFHTMQSRWDFQKSHMFLERGSDCCRLHNSKQSPHSNQGSYTIILIHHLCLPLIQWIIKLPCLTKKAIINHLAQIKSQRSETFHFKLFGNFTYIQCLSRGKRQLGNFCCFFKTKTSI